MTLFFLPSLTHLASVSVSLTVYKDDIIELFDLLARVDGVDRLGYYFYVSETHEKWMTERKMIARNKLCSLLPKIFLNQIPNMLQQLVDEFYFWIRDHWDIIKHIDRRHYMNRLCWKSEGTIDRPKTAEQLIQNWKINLKYRFIIACVYFREDNVVNCWQNMTAVEKKQVFHPRTNVAVLFWVRWLVAKDKPHWTQCISEYLGNNLEGKSLNYDTDNVSSRVRISSFFSRLNPAKNTFFIRRFWPEFAHYDDLRLCYCLADQAERDEIFHSDEHSKIAEVLCCYLDWPMQSLFLDLLNHVGDHLTFSCVAGILRYIVEEKLMRGMQDLDYQQLLYGLWMWIPDESKIEFQETFLFTLIRAALSYDEKTHPLPMEELLIACRNFLVEFYPRFYIG